MKRFSLLLFAAILSTVMMAQRKETTILEVAGNLATPLTVHTSKGTYTVYSSTELNGSVSVRSAEDANGNKVVVPNGDYKSHTSNGRSEYTRIYRFKTLYNNSSSSARNSGSSYGSRNYGGSSNEGGSYSNRRMPYEHLRGKTQLSTSLYGTWYMHYEIAKPEMKFETILIIKEDNVTSKTANFVDGEIYTGNFFYTVTEKHDNFMIIEYKSPRDYQHFVNRLQKGKVVSFTIDTNYQKVRLEDGKLIVYTGLIRTYYDNNDNLICTEDILLPTNKEIYYKIPDEI